MSEPRQNKNPRGGLLIVIGICLFLILVSSISPGFGETVRSGFNAVLMPMQKGMNRVGRSVFDYIEKQRDLSHVQEDNAVLSEEISYLREENARLKIKEKELSELRGLLNLREQYPEYSTLGAHVIGRSSGNWYQTLLIDKGERDGIQVGMNVLAGGGLVGEVSAVGKNSATVTTIINSGHYVSAMSARNGQSFLVAGDLNLYTDGMLRLENIPLESDISLGDMVVTSNISDVYLPGILIGYVEGVEEDSSRLQKVGTLRPVAPFDDLDMVLIITTLKSAEEPR